MIGYGSAAVNDQLVPVPVKAAFDPMSFGPAYTGPGMWPRQGVYNTPPVLPSPSLQASMAPASYGQSGTYPYPTAQDEAGSPWSLKKSPVLWVIIFLGVALFMLHMVHYR
jgi:hypothetical protein